MKEQKELPYYPDWLATVFGVVSMILLAGVIIFAMASCNPQKWCAKHNPPAVVSSDSVTHDSIYVHDSVYSVRIAPDSSSLVALLECQEGKVKLMQIIAYNAGNNISPATVKIIDNVIYVNCSVNEFNAFLKVRSSEVYKGVYTAKVYVKTTNYLTGWQNFWIRCGWISLSLIGLYLAYKILSSKITKVLNALIDKLEK